MLADMVRMTNGTEVAVVTTTTGSYVVMVTRENGETFRTGTFLKYRMAKDEQRFIIRLEGEGKLA